MRKTVWLLLLLLLLWAAPATKPRRNVIVPALPGGGPVLSSVEGPVLSGPTPTAYPTPAAGRTRVVVMQSRAADYEAALAGQNVRLVEAVAAPAAAWPVYQCALAGEYVITRLYVETPFSLVDRQGIAALEAAAEPGWTPAAGSAFLIRGQAEGNAPTEGCTGGTVQIAPAR